MVNCRSGEIVLLRPESFFAYYLASTRCVIVRSILLSQSTRRGSSLKLSVHNIHNGHDAKCGDVCLDQGPVLHTSSPSKMIHTPGSEIDM